MITLTKTNDNFYIKIFSVDTEEFNTIIFILNVKGIRYKKGLGSTHSNPKYLLNVVEELGDNFDIYISDNIKKEIEEYNHYVPSFKPRRLKIEKSFFEKFPPKGQYQIDDATRMACYGRFLNANKQGTGKTYETIQSINQLFFHKLIDRVLIIVIPVMMYNWKRELLMFSDLFNEDDFLIITEGNREKIYEKNLPKIVITSYDTFRLCSDYAYKQENPYKPFKKLTKQIENYCKENKIDLDKLDPNEKILRLERINKKLYNEKAKNYRKEQLDFSWWGDSRLIILDESHKIKNMDARRTQILHKHKHFFNYRFCLSGTPHPQGIQDLYSNLKFLDDNLVDANYVDFLHTIGEVGNSFSKYALASVDEEKANKLLERIKPYYCRRFLREVVKDLPEVIWKSVYIPFEGIQKQIYQSIVNEELTSIKEEKGFIQYKDLIVKFPYMMSVLSDPLLVADKILELNGS
jgi:SNF2 family DNA or RNA helicase